MKNKGRKHKAGHHENMAGILDTKGWLTHITRPITQMGRSPATIHRTGVSKRFTKKKWSKRVRGYFKSQTKEII